MVLQDRVSGGPVVKFLKKRSGSTHVSAIELGGIVWPLLVTVEIIAAQSI
jgi:hypothetical protein